jgi:hypothetical protein
MRKWSDTVGCARQALAAGAACRRELLERTLVWNGGT